MTFLRALASASSFLVIGTLAACAPASLAGEVTPVAVAGERPALSEIDFLTDPRSHEGSSTALLERAEISAPSAAPPQQLPVSFMSQELGDPLDVTITSTDRIMALDMSGSLQPSGRWGSANTWWPAIFRQRSRVLRTFPW